MSYRLDTTAHKFKYLTSAIQRVRCNYTFFFMHYVIKVIGWLGFFHYNIVQ